MSVNSTKYVCNIHLLVVGYITYSNKFSPLYIIYVLFRYVARAGRFYLYI